MAKSPDTSERLQVVKEAIGQKWFPQSATALSADDRGGVIKVSDVVGAIYAAQLRGALATTAKIYRTRIRELKLNLAQSSTYWVGKRIFTKLAKDAFEKLIEAVWFYRTMKAEQELEKALRAAFAAQFKALVRKKLNPKRRNSKMPTGWTSSRE